MKNYRQVGDFVEGFAKIRYHDGKYGFVHLHGEVLEGKYAEVEPFKDGVAYVKNEGGRWMPINREGKIVTKTYDYSVESSLQERKENSMRLKEIINDKIEGLNNYIDNMFDYIENVKTRYSKPNK